MKEFEMPELILTQMEEIIKQNRAKDLSLISDCEWCKCTGMD